MLREADGLPEGGRHRILCSLVHQVRLGGGTGEFSSSASTTSLRASKPMDGWMHACVSCRRDTSLERARSLCARSSSESWPTGTPNDHHPSLRLESHRCYFYCLAAVLRRHLPLSIVATSCRLLSERGRSRLAGVSSTCASGRSLLYQDAHDGSCFSGKLRYVAPCAAPVLLSWRTHCTSREVLLIYRSSPNCIFVLDSVARKLTCFVCRAWFMRYVPSRSALPH